MPLLDLAGSCTLQDMLKDVANNDYTATFRANLIKILWSLGCSLGREEREDAIPAIHAIDMTKLEPTVRACFYHLLFVFSNNFSKEYLD
jgi:hypothetical protein